MAAAVLALAATGCGAQADAAVARGEAHIQAEAVSNQAPRVTAESPKTASEGKVLITYFTRAEQNAAERPALKNHVENMEDYDVVYVGYPKMEQPFYCVECVLRLIYEQERSCMHSYG